MERLIQRMERIEQHFESIYVREEIDGKWQTASLAELPAKVAIKHVFRWLKEVMPTEGRDDNEAT